MEAYCEKLRELGAVFYAEIGDSLEAQEAGVLNEET